jgi:PEP-CTERM motif
MRSVRAAGSGKGTRMPSIINLAGTRASVGMALGAALLTGAAALPAQAKYVEADYTGIVLGFVPGQSLPGVNTGDLFSYKIVYDDSTFVDHTASVNAVLATIPGTVPLTSFFTADLSSDPKARLRISIGPVTFTKFDAVGYGTPEEGGPPDLGAGNFPNVEYIDGQFAGVGGFFINSAGYFLKQDPVAYAESFIPYPLLLGSLNSGYILAGYYPYPTSFSIHAVPEPSTWAMVLLGFAGVGAAIRSRRDPIQMIA